VVQPTYLSHITAIAFSPDSKYLASSNKDMQLSLWSVELQMEVANLQGHSKYVTSIAFSPDSKYLASGSQDKTVKLWSVDSQ
jgi:WD40 repeat protein